MLEQVPTGLFIGGSWRPARPGATWPVDDPATGKVLCEVADASPEDGMDALDAAVEAQPAFAAMAPRERGEILRRAFELITERIDDLALLMTHGDGQAAGRVEGRDHLRRGVLPLVRRGGGPDRGRLLDRPERRQPVPRSTSSRSASVC